MPLCRLGLTMLTICLLANLAQGQSFGRWHLPSTPGQFFGCGNSAGHHAPSIRMPGGRPLHVSRLAFVPPRDRMPDPGKYPASAYPSFDYAPTYPTGCNAGTCAPRAAPQVFYQQHPPQPTLVAPVASQPVFAAPVKPNKPSAKRPSAKKPVAKKRTFKKKPQPRRSATPQTAKPRPVMPRRQKPVRPPKKKNTLPEPPMPTTDPLATPDNHQATYGF